MEKSFFKAVISLFVLLYRLTNGRIGGSMRGLNVLLLTTTGRKSGMQRTTPLGYFRDNDDYIIIASNSGNDKNPSWYLNLTSNPQVTIQVKDRQLAVTAEPANPDRRNQLWQKLVTLAPAYKVYEKRTSRTIPVVILHPS